MAAFEIDGREYPIPSVFQLTMGEAQVLYDYSGYALEDFVPPVPGEPDDDRRLKVRNPAFKRAMVHITYQRGNPTMCREDVAKAVDGMQMWDMILDMLDVDADPTPVSQSRPENSNGNETPSTPESSGRPSTSVSGLPDGIRAPIGATG